MNNKKEWGIVGKMVVRILGAMATSYLGILLVGGVLILLGLLQRVQTEYVPMMLGNVVLGAVVSGCCCCMRVHLAGFRCVHSDGAGAGTIRSSRPLPRSAVRVADNPDISFTYPWRDT